MAAAGHAQQPSALFRLPIQGLAMAGWRPSEGLLTSPYSRIFVDPACFPILRLSFGTFWGILGSS